MEGAENLDARSDVGFQSINANCPVGFIAVRSIDPAMFSSLALFGFTRFITKVTIIYSHLAESSQLTTCQDL